MNDAVFRRAIADVDQRHPTSSTRSTATSSRPPTRRACCPTWDKYIDNGQRRQATASSTTRPTRRRILADAGYKMGSDGFFTQQGRLDDRSRRSSSPAAGPTGRQPSTSSPQSAQEGRHQDPHRVRRLQRPRTHKIQTGNFDLVLVNDVQIANTPWTYYNWMFRHADPEAVQNAGNDGRYKNAEAWSLVQQLDKTPVEQRQRR